MTVFSEACEMHDCSQCTDMDKRRWFCPDLGLRDPSPRLRKLGADDAGRGGMEFDQCPGFWRRLPGIWGDVAHAASSSRTAGSVAYDIKYALDKGTVDLLSMPGKARDAVVLLIELDADRQRAELAHLANAKKGR